MKPNLSWIDPDAFSIVLSEVSTDPEPSPTPPTFSTLDIGFWPENRPGEAARQHEAVPAAGETQCRPAFVPRKGKLQDRFENLIEWILLQLPCEQVFLADREGLILAHRAAEPELVAASSWFLSSWAKVHKYLNPEGLAAHSMQLHGDRLLHLFQGAAPWGQMSLGVVSEKPLDRNLTKCIQDALQNTIKEE